MNPEPPQIDKPRVAETLSEAGSRLGRMRLAYRATRSILPRQLPPLVGRAVASGLHLATDAGLYLDRLLVPAIDRRCIVRPIVLTGMPRTGSTFLHRFLVEHGVGAGLQLWQMLVPSLTMQAAVRPLLPRMERLSPARGRAAATHETSLTAVETDDAALYFRFFDGFFLYAFHLAFADDDLRPLVDPRWRDTAARDFAWLERLWRRSLHTHAHDRIVAKLFSLAARLPAFLARFPGAKVLFMARDPQAMLPSTMSLVTGVLEQRTDFGQLPAPVRTRYVERLYGAFLTLMLRFHEDWTGGRIPREQVFVVRYDRLMDDFEALMQELLSFLDVPAAEPLQQAIAREAARQRAYRSAHAYSLATFGLEAAQIRRDFAFYYDAFL